MRDKDQEIILESLSNQHPEWRRGKLSKASGIPSATVGRWLAARKADTGLINIVKLCDWHIPYQDDKAVNCAINYCKSIQPDVIIVDEVHDFYDLSKFDKNPERVNGTQDEIDIATTYFKQLREACPDSRIILLESNHLDRLRRLLWKDGKAISGLRCLQVEKVLELAENKMEYMRHFFFRGVLFKHGDLVRKYSAYTAKGEYEKEGCAGASGHTHRLGVHFTTKRGGSYCWVEGGCLCDLHPEYIKGVPDWQHGITRFTFERDGTQYFPQAIPIINGKLISGGKVISWDD